MFSLIAKEFHWALAWARKWGIARGREKIFDLGESSPLALKLNTVETLWVSRKRRPKTLWKRRSKERPKRRPPRRERRPRKRKPLEILSVKRKIGRTKLRSVAHLSFFRWKPNLVPRAYVPFGQHQDTELWNNQFPETKILGSVFFSDHFGGFVSIPQAPQGPFYMSHRGSEE